jgi:CHASE3 domain sensor protein
VHHGLASRLIIRAKMAELQRTIDLHNAGKYDEAIALVQSDEGLSSMAAERQETRA